MQRPSGQDESVRNPSIFRMLRLFSAASLAGVVLAIVLLTLLYRQVAIDDLVRIGERGNQLLAQSFLNAVRTPLLAYLGNEDHHRGLPFPADLTRSLTELMRGTAVTRVKIYDDEGIVLFSTQAEQIGARQHDNPGVRAGLAGRVASELIFRDRMNPFDRETESDNLIQTYIPIRQDDLPVLGVFELYGDLNPLVAGIERAEFLVLGGSATILILLYLALLTIVRHAARIIAEQQETIRERSHSLELLSTQLISTQEADKKRLAFELHEGIAQILSSIKYQMEHACRPNGLPCPEGQRPLEALVPAIQNTIQEVRTLAMDLRPSSIDDLGLLPTLDWYSREFPDIYPDIELAIDRQVEESDFPKPLKLTLFRLIQLMCEWIARQGCANRIGICLGRSDDRIWLELRDDCPISMLSREQRAERDLYLLTLRERITLAGGDMAVLATDAGSGTQIRATWAAAQDEAEHLEPTP